MLKKLHLISIFVACILYACASSYTTPETVENVNIGNQSVQIHFSYERNDPLSTKLEIENQSEQPVYLPWGIDHGYNLILVNSKSHMATTFGKNGGIPEQDIRSYFELFPGDKESSELRMPPFDLEPGEYNLCAELLIINGSNHAKPRICIPVMIES